MHLNDKNTLCEFLSLSRHASRVRASTDFDSLLAYITFGDGILACMSRDFDIFMSKHLAGQWQLNSYYYLYSIANSNQLA